MQDLLSVMKAFTARQILKTIENETSESRKEWLLHMFKYFAKYQKQNETYQFWQKISHPIALTTSHIFKQKLNYIHQNPVIAGHVSAAEYWKYSSANEESAFKVN